MVAAAEQGFAAAFVQAAQFLRDGEGVESDLSRAAFFFKQAADNGDAQSQLETARNFDNGFGMPKDREEAVRYYQLSAAQGLIEAEMKLAEAFNQGDGIKADFLNRPLSITCGRQKRVMLMLRII